MKLMKNIIILISILMIISFIFTSCSNNNNSGRSVGEDEQMRQTSLIIDEINRQVGLPNIVNFQQKKTMKMIYELCDREDLICYAYLKSDYNGQLFFIGKCVGYGVPFSAQYTNPQKYFNDPYGDISAGSLIISQADPNGLYMPTSSSATWLMMVDPKTNEPRPVYIEPEIIISPFPLPCMNSDDVIVNIIKEE